MSNLSVCEKCGTERNEGDLFCGNCGTKFESEQNNQSPSSSPERNTITPVHASSQQNFKTPTPTQTPNPSPPIYPNMSYVKKHSNKIIWILGGCGCLFLLLLIIAAAVTFYVLHSSGNAVNLK